MNSYATPVNIKKNVNGSTQLNESIYRDMAGESEISEVLVDLPESLQLAAGIEAKRTGLSLEQWILNTVVSALKEGSVGEREQ